MEAQKKIKLLKEFHRRLLKEVEILKKIQREYENFMISEGIEWSQIRILRDKALDNKEE